MSYIPKSKGDRIILTEYQKGITNIIELVNKTGYSKSSVYHCLCKFRKTEVKNVEYNGRLISKMTYDIILDLQSGKRQFELAKKYGVSRQRINNLSKKIKVDWYDKKKIKYRN